MDYTRTIQLLELAIKMCKEEDYTGDIAETITEAGYALERAQNAWIKACEAAEAADREWAAKAGNPVNDN